jgi:hypothetical protein
VNFVWDEDEVEKGSFVLDTFSERPLPIEAARPDPVALCVCAGRREPFTRVADFNFVLVCNRSRALE